ncbi:MAG: hypothetical protein M1812_002825 [Candelaria pacifica]|nr:MAG: hypothetical protein M1812_002825 [Candelaria pacifica]
MAPPNRQTMLMDHARGRATFEPRQLTYIIYGGEDMVKLREEAASRVEEAILGTDPMKLPPDYENNDRGEAYLAGLAFGKVLIDEEVQHRHGIYNATNHQGALMSSSPYGLHSLMFIPTIKLQGTHEQQAYWVPLAEAGTIIGAYVQTELGHGTFVRGLETTATFDPETDEFIVDSPTITSTKYWPGGLAFTATHAIVMAQLIIGKQAHGLHPFIVQLRSLADHQPMKGIELGDIGLKAGYNGTDNGYATFDHVRIPRTQLLMGFSKVLRDGTYIKAPHDKLAYITMIATRNLIINTVGFQLARAATIAIRYSTVREQGVKSDEKDAVEVPIMSYKHQHHRLLTIMSQAFAIVFSAKACDAIYQDTRAHQSQGDNSTLPYCHITMAGMKAYATQVAADGVEDARKCCGGHGFSLLSGMPELVVTVTPCATLEGENHVMYQQVARYLSKQATIVKNGGQPDAPISYLSQGREVLLSSNDLRCTAKGDDFLDPAVLVSIFHHRAVRLILDSSDNMDKAQADGQSYSTSFNVYMMSLFAAARAHVELFVLESYLKHLSTVTDESTRKVLQHLWMLFALVAICDGIGAVGFVEDGYIKLSQLHTMRGLVNDMLEALVPESIALTDSWNYSDATLKSALGMKDGNVYETLMAWTRQIPINRDLATQKEGYERFIKPILKANL